MLLLDELIYNIDRPMYSSRMSHNTSKSDIIVYHRKLKATRYILSKPTWTQLFLEQKYSRLLHRIYTADNHLFQYNGGALTPNSNAKVPNEVTAEKNVTSSSSLWVFQELSGDVSSTPSPTPYSVSYLYNPITRRFWDWWMVRSIPKTRNTLNTAHITGWEHN